MTGIYKMKKFGCPVIFDGTHNVQKPGGNEAATSGNREYVLSLSKSTVADGLFLETYISSGERLSDGPNMIPLGEINNLVKICLNIYEFR